MTIKRIKPEPAEGGQSPRLERHVEEIDFGEYLKKRRRYVEQIDFAEYLKRKKQSQPE
ncbi:MAG: hypothetical protein HY695_33095 [Deltaproteobacteria bacterium]|nr:hypothetical protein [Deltaproteobacteria bacterium]